MDAVTLATWGKTKGLETTVHGSPVKSVSWDSTKSLDGLTTFDMGYGVILYKISDLMFTEVDVMGGTFAMEANGEKNSVPVSEMQVYVEDGYISIVDMVIVYPDDTVTEHGVYIYPDMLNQAFGGAWSISLVCGGVADGALLVMQNGKPVWGGTIDPKYIPPMDSLTLVSPDGTSYKVTVDDSGNLTATAT